MLLLLTLMSCSLFPSFEEPKPPEIPVAPPTPPPPPKVEPAGLLKQGKYEDLLAEIWKTPPTTPEASGLWDLLELAALRSGKAAEQVDKLAVDQALGGDVAHHHAVRGALAIAARRPADALASAAALEAVSPGDAAALVAQAVALGAPPPATLTPAETALLALLKDPKAPWDPQVDALPGWRVALLRGQAQLARGQKEAALAEATKAESGGQVAREGVTALRVQAAPTPEDAWLSVLGAVKDSGEGDPDGVARLMKMGIPAAMEAWKAGELSNLADTQRSAAASAKNEGAAGALALVQAEANLRNGEVLVAFDAATAAAKVEALKADASWQLVLINAALGDSAAVEAAAADAPGPRKTAGQELAKAMRGEAVSLPSAGLTDSEGALQCLLAAGWQTNPRPLRETALKLSSHDPDLRIWAELSLDRRKLNLGDTPTARTEASVRSYLASGKGGALEDTTHPDIAAWKAILGKDPAPTGGAGVEAWAAARAALASGDLTTAAQKYATVAIGVPAWRTGPWEPLLALEGPYPEDMNSDASAMAGASDPLPFTVLMHSWSHRVNANRALWRAGVTPVPTTTLPEKRRAVWDALAGHRMATIAWIAGKGPAPAETAKDLAAAEDEAGLVNFQPPNLPAIRGTLPKAALLSFRPVPSGTELLVLTESDSRVVPLPARFSEDIASLLRTLPSGDAKDVGNKVRSQLLDPLTNDLLLRLGRYLVVGEGNLAALPITALPEQEDGQRYLMEIRSVGHYTTFDQLIQTQDLPGDYTTDMLALCASNEEADAVRHVFPNGTILVDKAITLATWREKAPKAHYIHIGNLPAAPDGGIKMADGNLSLAEIGSSLLVASAAYVEGSSGPAAVLRAQILRKAGVQEVLAQGWGSSAKFDSHLVGYWWELTYGKTPAAVGRALSEARPRALQEEDPGIRRQPDVWGGYYVMGRF